MYKVLLVDDEKSILEGLTCILKWEEFGIEITGQCLDGTDALELISTTKIDILITDIKMNKMNGLELIKQIRERNANIKCIVLSGYDDFDYIKDAMLLGIENYLLKPVSTYELASTIKNTIQKIEKEMQINIEFRHGLDVLKDNILYRWVKGDIEKDEFLERASLLGLEIGKINYAVAVIHVISESKSSMQHGVVSKKPIRLTINKICDEVLPGDLSPLCFCDISGDVVVLFSDGNHTPHSFIRNMLSECIKNMNDDLGVDVFITVGNMEKLFKDVGTSYENAKNMQEYQLIMPPNTLLLYEEVLSYTEKHKKQTNIDINRIENFILSRDRDGAIAFVEKVYCQIKSIGELNPEYIRNISLEILLHIKLSFNKLFFNPDKFLNDFRSAFYKTFRTNAICELEKYTKEIINKGFEYIYYKNSEFSPLTKRVIDYTRKNYMLDINLKTIAVVLNTSPGYLGYMIKRETGELFTNYLNYIRIEAAKQLLINPKTKISEVAMKVGYTNISYFSIVFKKAMSMSPIDYRRSISSDLAV